jgi:hypothetical protein
VAVSGIHLGARLTKSDVLLHFPELELLELVQVGQPGLNSHSFISELTSLPCGFSFDVILQDVSLFLLASH